MYGENFVWVVGGLRPPTTHTKPFSREEINRNFSATGLYPLNIGLIGKGTTNVRIKNSVLSRPRTGPRWGVGRCPLTYCKNNSPGKNRNLYPSFMSKYNNLPVLSQKLVACA